MTYVHVTRKTIDNFVEVSAREDPVRLLPLAISAIYEWHEVNSYKMRISLFARLSMQKVKSESDWSTVVPQAAG